MARVRFLHTADWQLGMTRHFLSEEAQARFGQERIEGIRRVGELAREHAAAFVVVAGDVFESNQIDRQTVVRALDAMSAIPVPVLLLPGNHDPLDAASVYRSSTFQRKKPENVIVLAGSEPVAPEGTTGVEVVGAPWESKRPLADGVAALAARLEPALPGRTRVAVAHGAVDALSPDRENPAVIRLAAAEAALREGRFHYLALGDRHSVTRVGDTGVIWYSGAHVATDYDEQKPGHVLVVDVAAGEPPAVEPVPLRPEGAWRFLDLRFDLNGPEDLAALERALGETPHKERTLLRLTLVGTLSLALHARLEALLEDYRAPFASLRVRERHTDLAVVPDEMDAEPLRLSGYARAAWDELARAAERGGEEARAARDALALFYRLAAGEEGARPGGAA